MNLINKYTERTHHTALTVTHDNNDHYFTIPLQLFIQSSKIGIFVHWSQMEESVKEIK